MQLKELRGKIQVKLNQYCRRYTAGFSRPLQKFIGQMIFGILKGGKVQLNSIARSLQEGNVKKTSKRLGRNLGHEGLWKQVSSATLKTQRSYLKKCKYMVLDLSDIQKEYAEKMAGLADVYDGSEHEKGPGYWLNNVTGVDESGALIVPAYSELYSLAEENSSENIKLSDAIDMVSQYVGPDKIWVDDRGGDRKSIMGPLLDKDRQFIIRQVGNRDLYYKGQKLPLKQISRKVELTETYTALKIKKNQKVKETYDCGAVQVRLTANGKDLWLVVLKERGKGYCWLLCHLKNLTLKEAIKTAFTGYGHRWKIEEVHRQIKGDYELEAICLQRYEALKSMNALLWASVSFLYTRLESLSLEIIFHSELCLVNRRKLSDLLRFIYYKLALAFRKLFALVKWYDKCKYSTPTHGQLCLSLE